MGGLDGSHALSLILKLELIKLAANKIPRGDPKLLIAFIQFAPENPGEQYHRTNRRGGYVPGQVLHSFEGRIAKGDTQHALGVAAGGPQDVGKLPGGGLLNLRKILALVDHRTLYVTDQLRRHPSLPGQTSSNFLKTMNAGCGSFPLLQLIVTKTENGFLRSKMGNMPKIGRSGSSGHRTIGFRRHARSMTCHWSDGPTCPRYNTLVRI